MRHHLTIVHAWFAIDCLNFGGEAITGILGVNSANLNTMRRKLRIHRGMSDMSKLMRGTNYDWLIPLF